MGGTRSTPVTIPRSNHAPVARHQGATRVAMLLAVFAMAAGLLSAVAILHSADQSAEAALLAEVQRLVASDGGNDDFGRSVAISGDIAVVGAHGDDAAASDAGAAYVFERNAGGTDNWGEVAKLTASDAETNDRFGHSVAVSGNIVVVGAKDEDAAGSGAGAAYIFERDQGGAGNWGEVKKLTASDAASNEVFGYSVAADADTVVVTAIHDGRYQNNPGGYGAAYVFQQDQGGAGNWGEVMKIVASDGEVGDDFGWSVAISGDTVVAGAQDNANDTGAAYVFDRDTGGADTWGEVKKLTASDAAVDANFGYDVAVSGPHVLVGALAEDSQGLNAGAAYLFSQDQGGVGNWGEVKKITASNTAAGDNFATSVSISGEVAIIGSPNEDSAGLNAGAGYVLQRDQGGADNWGETKKITTSGVSGFGFDSAISGLTAIAGAGNNNAAFIFEEPPPPTPTFTPCPMEGCPPTPTPTVTPTITDTPPPTPTGTPIGPDDGSKMSIRVNGQEGPIVEVVENSTFIVTVHADTIPLPNGYTIALTWIDYGNTGLVGKQNQEMLWPDCSQFFAGTLGNAESANCLTGLINLPASFYIGPLSKFELTCDAQGPQHTIRLLAMGDATAGVKGSGYVEFEGGGIPAEHVDIGGGVLVADEIIVECNLQGDPPLPDDWDDDGCTNAQEQQTAPGSQTLGGLRDYLNHWDFYDVAIAGGASGQDRQIDVFNDVVGVIDHYSPMGNLPYDVRYDRGPSTGPDPWNMTAPDGIIDLFNDIVGVLNQGFHDCR